jgi:hypothetical protein
MGRARGQFGPRALYDAQLARAPLHAVLHAEARLKDFLAGTARSPIVAEG